MPRPPPAPGRASRPARGTRPASGARRPGRGPRPSERGRRSRRAVRAPGRGARPLAMTGSLRALGTRPAKGGRRALRCVVRLLDRGASRVPGLARWSVSRRPGWRVTRARRSAGRRGRRGLRLLGGSAVPAGRDGGGLLSRSERWPSGRGSRRPVGAGRGGAPVVGAAGGGRGWPGRGQGRPERGPGRWGRHPARCPGQPGPCSGLPGWPGRRCPARPAPVQAGWGARLLAQGSRAGCLFLGTGRIRRDRLTARVGRLVIRGTVLALLRGLA